jgi:sigma54-dependent transcription regulator
MFNVTKGQIYSLIDFALRSDSSYSLGMMVQAECCKKDYESSGHVHVISLLDEVYQVSASKFKMFIEDQVQLLEDGKVTKKKGGILPSFLSFFV